MTEDPIVTTALQELAQFNPKSVFLYGSRGRGDAKPDSDYEVGVIFDDDKYVQRSDIHAAISNPNVKAYPFKWEELLHGTFGHVFQKSIYLREIIKGGRTIAGDHLVEQIPPPPITTLDLIQRLRFDIGMALAALLSFRAGDMQTSMEEFSKSCFFGVRCLEILELKTFPVGYDEIYELSAKVITDAKYKAVLEAARAVRTGGTTADINILYDNISLLDSFIEPKLIAAFNANGNQTII
ncbi:MAG: nucleotidyltransferase domain-containing protein [Candidatus Saccharimonas sp.]